MRTTLLSLILPAIFLSFLLTACKKDPTKNAKLPPITREGKNTIGFTIDREVWVPYYKCGFMRDPCGETNARVDEVRGGPPNGIDFGFTRASINMKNTSHLTISSSGTGTITTTGDKIDSVYVSFRDETQENYIPIYRGPLPGSKFNITKIDFENQIISGEFEFILRKYNGAGETITLKDGRFDFKFNTCKCSH